MCFSSLNTDTREVTFVLKAQLAQRTQAKPTEVTAGGFGLSFICGRVCRCPLVLGQQYRIWADAVFGEKKKNIHGWRLLWQCPAAVCLLCPAPRSPLGTAVQLDAGTEPAAGVCLQ